MARTKALTKAGLYSQAQTLYKIGGQRDAARAMSALSVALNPFGSRIISQTHLHPVALREWQHPRMLFPPSAEQILWSLHGRDSVCTQPYQTTTENVESDNKAPRSFLFPFLSLLHPSLLRL